MNMPGDEHAELSHWSTMAVFASLVLLWALVGSTDRTGWRITAWLAGASAVIYGVGSLAFPNVASAADAGWAVAAIAWGVVFVGLTERRARSQRAGVSRSPAEAATLRS